MLTVDLRKPLNCYTQPTKKGGIISCSKNLLTLYPKYLGNWREKVEWGERRSQRKELMVKMHPYNKMSFLMDAHYRNNINSVLGLSLEKYECNLSF